MKSIMQGDNDCCYLCQKLGPIEMAWGGLETHHVFSGTANRKLSERHGLKVRLCVGHHREGQRAVHRNAETARILKQDAQRAFEKKHSHEDFMRIFGKNYLDDMEEEICDPMEAGMEDAAECARAGKETTGPPPGIRFLEEAGGDMKGDPGLWIGKAEVAYVLTDRQFRNLVEILEVLDKRDTAERL